MEPPDNWQGARGLHSSSNPNAPVCWPDGAQCFTAMQLAPAAVIILNYSCVMH